MKTILVDAVFCLVTEEGKLFEEMHNLLEAYPNSKIVLTGANDEQFKKFGLDRVPYKVFSLKHNPEKSDPKYYRILLKQFDLSASETIYFEHDQAAVRSAQSVGIKTYQYNNETKDLVLLKQFIDSNL